MANFIPREQKEKKKLSINFDTIITRILRNWWVILIGTLIAAMLSYVFVTENYKRQYTATATFIVSSKGSATTTMFANLESTRSLASAVAITLRRAELHQMVFKEAGIKSFRGTINSDVVSNTNILSLSVTSDSPEAAYAAINAIIDHHQIVVGRVVKGSTLNVLMRPTMPQKPDVPLNRRKQVVLYSAIAAILITAAIAVSAIFTDRIYREQDVADKIGDIEKLATLERQKRRLKNRSKKKLFKKKIPVDNLLINNPTTGFGYSETTRLLQTRIQYLMKLEGHKSLLVSSVDADEGRSTIATNLALAFARENKKVLLVEGDLGEPSIAKMLGIDKELPVSIDQYLICGEGTLELPTLENAKNVSLMICRGKVHNSFDLLSSQRMQRFMENAKREYDVIIVDSPPVAVSNITEFLAELCDAAIMVIRQGFATSKRITTALSTISSNCDMLGYVFNDVKHLPFFDGAGQTVTSSTGYGMYGRRKKGSYGNYGGYGSYGRYGSYGNYGRYGNYGKYGKYGSYGNYGAYGDNGFTSEPLHDIEMSDVRPVRDEQNTSIRSRQRSSEFETMTASTQDAEPVAEKEIDLFAFIVSTLKTFLRIILVPIILFAVLAALLCYREKASFVPKYRSSATFNISIIGSSGATADAYSGSVAQRLSSVFPHILNSGLLNNLIREDMGIKTVPATLQTDVQVSTALITMTSTASNPQDAYDVLLSAINNYPKVANYVVGNTEINLINEPTVPTRASNRISYKNNFIIAGAVAAAVGFALAVVLNISNRRVGGVEELRETLNIRCIGTIPYDTGRKESEDKVLLLNSKNTSREFTDAITLIRKRLDKTASQYGDKVILFVGSVPGEGKSTAAINTAYALSTAGKRVVFIDADIRKPSTIGALKKVKSAGLVEYLKGEVEISDILSEIDTDIYAIRGATKNYNVPELLRSSKMHELIDTMREQFDFVIVDAPPSAILADAQIIAQYADAIIYVVCQDYTTKSSLITGVNNVSNSGARFIGYVLNNAGVSATGHAYGKHNKYSSYGKYGGYGKYGKYGRHGAYGKYGSYGRYGKYGAYGDYGAYADAAIDAETNDGSVSTETNE